MSDDTRIHQLHADIMTCKQGGDSVEEYYGKIKVLWDHLANFDKGSHVAARMQSVNQW